MPQANLKTENYGEATIVASSLDENGIDFIYSNLVETENRFGIAFVAVGTKDGEYIGIMFNSQKLATLFTKEHARLTGKKINLSKRGEGVSTNFDVKFV